MTPNKGTVLFVEGENDLLDIYSDYFNAEGYNFLSAKDVGEALSITEFKQPDAVLLDIVIPREEKSVVNLFSKQGYSYLEAVKKNPKTKDIPIIIFTNMDSYKDRKKSRDMGAAAFIFKRDCTPKEVLDTVEKVINLRKTT